MIGRRDSRSGAAQAGRLAIGTACLLGAAALGAALDGVRGEVALDRLSRRVVGPPSPVSGPTAIRLAQLSDRGPILVALLLVAGVAAVRYRSLRPVLTVAATAALAQGLVVLGKRLVDRTLFSSGTSYPSGHVAGATAVLVLAVLVAGHDGIRIRLLVGVLVAPLVLGTALGALWTQSHVLTDVLGGGLVGAGSALVAWSVLGPRPSLDRGGTAPRPAPGSRLPSVARQQAPVVSGSGAGPRR